MRETDRFEVVVAIPARNEAERIGSCMASLADQTFKGRFAVIVLANNCADNTAELARSHAHSNMILDVREVDLPSLKANAGQARRLALDAGAGLVSPDGILLTTDADAVADASWVIEMVSAFAQGNDAVAGAVSADWNELSQFPPDVLKIGGLEWDYQKLSAHIEALADPQPHDPWPRHNQNCGANAGITAAFYERIGGLPTLPVGEDRAMFDAVRALDGRVRHSLLAHVTASARTVGRACGGMADALASRHNNDYLCDDVLEPVADLVRRATWRHQGRVAWQNNDLFEWFERIGLDQSSNSFELGTPFGTIWALVEQTHPRLQKQRLHSDALGEQIESAKRYLERLKALSHRVVFEPEDAVL